jgi:hypothetical protein
MPSSSRRSIAHRPQFVVAKNCDGGAGFSTICSRRVGGWPCHALGPHDGNSADAKEVIITEVSPNPMPDKNSCLSESCANQRLRNTCFACCLLFGIGFLKRSHEPRFGSSLFKFRVSCWRCCLRPSSC